MLYLSVLDLILIIIAVIFLVYLYNEHKTYRFMTIFDWCLAIIIILITYGGITYWFNLIF